MKKLVGLVTLLVTLGMGVDALAYNAKTKEIVVGTTAGDFADLVKEGLKPVLEKEGYRVKLVEFTDYVRPNLALAEGSLDVNIFQHKPYLEEFSKEKKLNLVPIAEVPTAPLGLYAGKSKALASVHPGSSVAVPNDPTNLARALVILSDSKWVTLAKNIDLLRVTPKDIAVNKQDLKIIQLEAAQLPRALADVDYAIINGNYATGSGLKLTDALEQEKSDAYINWAVVKKGDAGKDFVKAVVAGLKSKPLKTFAQAKFPGYKYPKDWVLTAE